jgi:hypothetical protein
MKLLAWLAWFFILGYVGSYAFLSRLGMLEYIGTGSGNSGTRVWGFRGIRQQLDRAMSDQEWIAHERRLSALFLPLVKIDTVWGNVHYLEEEAEEVLDRP